MNALIDSKWSLCQTRNHYPHITKAKQGPAPKCSEGDITKKQRMRNEPVKGNPAANTLGEEHSRYVDLLVGISPFEEGIDCLCECCGHRQRVLGSHGERTGSSGAAWRWNKHTQRCEHNPEQRPSTQCQEPSAGMETSWQTHCNPQAEATLFLADIVDGKTGERCKVMESKDEKARRVKCR